MVKTQTFMAESLNGLEALIKTKLGNNVAISIVYDTLNRETYGKFRAKVTFKETDHETLPDKDNDTER